MEDDDDDAQEEGNGDVLDVNENYEQMDDDEEMGGGDDMDAEFDAANADDKQLAGKQNKKLIRCTYWPACDKGEQCPYLHPNKPCTAFPSCQFGQLCHYLHPSCRYDGFCTRLDCAFTHLLKKPAQAAASAPTAAASGNETVSIIPATAVAAAAAGVATEPKANVFKSTPKITINKIQSNYFNTDQMEMTTAGGGLQSKTFNSSRRSAPNSKFENSF